MYACGIKSLKGKDFNFSVLKSPDKCMVGGYIRKLACC